MVRMVSLGDYQGGISDGKGRKPKTHYTGGEKS